ncbi:DUF2637 domain-containing protein [Nesterenkonia salmonea]|uniref:DUF2637 domain-containing protein n=1 Tax=Nesterenkonia salmonea TaxID=1804987 RepID=A0A5R9B5C8_9MICC|nr:DUF2637 domain-containing protein [Nesterenkonia salmonea]TLP90500.1 DUF2637 domain-containing protein [Nesterenkonia salmonea]
MSTGGQVSGVGHRWALRTAVAGTVFIAGGAFWLSFNALADLAARSGIEPGQAWVWPLIVDGIIVVATVSAVALAGQRAAWYPWALLAGGALVSVTANSLHAVVAADVDVPGVLAASVAAVPPVVLLAITHLTVILTRTSHSHTTDSHTDQSGTPAPAPTVEDDEAQSSVARVQEVTEGSTGLVSVTAEAPAAVEDVSVDRRARARMLREQGWSNKQIAKQLGVHPSTVGRWAAAGHLTDEPSTSRNGRAAVGGTNEQGELS